MRVVDTLLAFPGILLATVLITIMGPGLFSVGVAIAVFNIPFSARLARAGVLRERERDYVTAACGGEHVWGVRGGATAVGVASVLTMAALNFLSDVLSARLDPVRHRAW